MLDDNTISAVTAMDVIAAAGRLGFYFSLDNGKPSLRYLDGAKRIPVPPELAEHIRRHRDEIIALIGSGRELASFEPTPDRRYAIKETETDDASVHRLRDRDQGTNGDRRCDDATPQDDLQAKETEG